MALNLERKYMHFHKAICHSVLFVNIIKKFILMHMDKLKLGTPDFMRVAGFRGDFKRVNLARNYDGTFDIYSLLMCCWLMDYRINLKIYDRKNNIVLDLSNVLLNDEAFDMLPKKALDNILDQEQRRLYKNILQDIVSKRMSRISKSMEGKRVERRTEDEIFGRKPLKRKRLKLQNDKQRISD